MNRLKIPEYKPNFNHSDTKVTKLMLSVYFVMNLKNEVVYVYMCTTTFDSECSATDVPHKYMFVYMNFNKCQSV